MSSFLDFKFYTRKQAFVNGLDYPTPTAQLTKKRHLSAFYEILLSRRMHIKKYIQMC